MPRSGTSTRPTHARPTGGRSQEPKRFKVAQARGCQVRSDPRSSWAEAYKSAFNSKDSDFLDTRKDCQYVEPKTFEVPGVDQPVDSLSREVTVGEYNTMFGF